MSICGQLTSHPEAWSSGSRRDSLLVKFLFVLKTFQNPSSLTLYKLTIFVSVYCQNQSTFDKIVGRMFIHIHKVINVIVYP